VVTFSDLERLREWARATSRRVRVKFRRYPYTLVIDKMIRAEDPEGRTVPWHRAFGAKQPHQVLASFPIARIEVVDKETGRREEINSLEELFRRAGVI